MYDEYGDRGYVPLGINLWQDMESVVKLYARAYSYPFFRDAGAGWNAYRMNGYIPLNYVIDTAGIVVGSMEGFNESTIRSWIEPYLTGVNEEQNQPRLVFNRITPNPVTNTQSVNFTIPETRNVSLRIYAASGDLICTLLNGNIPAGNHTVVWNTTDRHHRLVPNGLYFYELTAGKNTIRYKTTVLR
uniref:T9SS type A sorting domain-containing protein n=1 Tax=candidate division WOR-3 bacterium TaxID=2052148 RepID=A0A7V3PSK6_UNCW3